MLRITGSVGNNGQNRTNDVRTVQELLNKNIKHLYPLLPLKPDGACGPITIGLIREFQRRKAGLSKPDGRVDPDGKTFLALIEATSEARTKIQLPTYDRWLLAVQQLSLRPPTSDGTSFQDKQTRTLTEVDYEKAAHLLSVEVATVKAVAAVESKGSGFLSNGKPKILFEGHWFSKLTKRQYDKSYPSISYGSWTKKHYLGGISEYSRYETAFALDKDAAMKSTSWGSFQIMGFNYSKCGYASVSEFVGDMYKSDAHQLNSFVHFLKSSKLDVHLKTKSWAAFAEGYNGPRYAENGYDTKLKQAYEAYSTK